MPNGSELSGLATGGAPRCAFHPEQPAGWRCDGCGALCPDCVERVQVNPRTEYDTCVRCDTPTWRLLRPGPPRPFEELLRDHWHGHVSWRAIPLLFLVLVWAEVTLLVEHGHHGLLAIVASWLAAHVAASAFLAVTQDTARGPEEVDRSESLDLVSDAIRPGVPLALLLFAWLWLPTVAAKLGVPAHHALWNPLLLLLDVGLGAALPWLAIRIAVSRHSARLPEPAALPRRLFRLGALAGLFMHLFLFGSSWALEIGLWLWKSPLLGLWGFAEPSRMAAGLTLLLLARITGFMLHARAPELGFPLPDCYQVPVLEGVPPRGRRPSAPPRDYSPLEL